MLTPYGIPFGVADMFGYRGSVLLTDGSILFTILVMVLEVKSVTSVFCTAPLSGDLCSFQSGALSPSGAVVHDAQTSASFYIWRCLLTGTNCFSFF